MQGRPAQLLIALALCAAPGFASSSQVFKCIGDNGHITYQDFACTAAGEQLVLNVRGLSLTATESPARVIISSNGDSSGITPASIPPEVDEDEDEDATALAVEIISTNIQFEALSGQAAQCNDALLSSDNMSSCERLKARFETSAPQRQRFIDLAPVARKNPVTQQLWVAGQRELRLASRVYERLQTD